MHASLTLAANLTVQALSAVVLGATLGVFKPPHPEIALLSCALGALAGGFQSQALQQSPELFRNAMSSTEIREHLTAHRTGRGSIGLMWLNGIMASVLLGVGMLHPAAAIACFAAFTLAREMVCRRDVRALNSPLMP